MEPSNRPPHRPTGASFAALVGIGVAVAGVVVLHIVRADLDPRRAVMSHYANGSAGVIMSIVFYAVGAAALALAVRLWTGMARHGSGRLLAPIMGVAGIAMVLAGVFEVDRPDAPQTTGEVIHSNSAVAAFILLVVAMGLFTLACRHDERWLGFRRRSAVLTCVAALAAVGSKASTGTSWSGAVQRVLAGTVLLWLLLVARQLRSRAFAATDAALPPRLPDQPVRPGGPS